MEFEEVKVVWNKVIPPIREAFIAVELVDYVTDYFSIQSCQRIRAQSKQHGTTAANDEFFEEAKRKPGSFPVILAALKKENQIKVLELILERVKIYIKTGRQAIVFGLIKDAAKSLGISLDEEIAAVLRQGPIGQPEAPDQSSVSPLPVTTENPAFQRQTQQRPSEQQAVQIVTHVPNPQPSALQSSGQVIYQRLQKPLPDIPLSNLKATSRKKISETFLAVHKDEPDPVWQVLLDNADLDIDSQKARQIECSRHPGPGKEFYDNLRDLGFTTGQLIDLLQNHGCSDAADIVRQEAGNVASVQRNQPSVIPPYKEDLAKFDENNLDLARQRSQEEQLSKLNIRTPQRSAQPNYSSNSPTSLEHSDTSDNNSYAPEDISIDSVAEGKGTQAVEAIGDRENEKSTLTPEGEREKLRNDRVSQHDDNQSNLNSFKDLKEASNQSKDMNVCNQPSSHDFSSTSGLHQPELYQQQAASQNPGSQSNAQETGTQHDTTEKVLLEHMEGPVNYAAQVKSESMRKLHSDDDSVRLSLSSLQLNENETQAIDQRGVVAVPPRETEDSDQEQFK